MKCDEAKPACKRCTTTGRRCDGYTTLLLPQPDPCAAPTPCTTWSERRMFFFFRTETASRVAGPFDQSFWTVDLLRATAVHPAIWHASIAVAAMYKRYTIPAGEATAALRSGLYEFALAQYNASISGLVGVAGAEEGPGPDGRDVILATSVLYSGLCSLRGDPKEAFLHMRSGLGLFRQWRHWERKGRRGAGRGGVLPVDSIITLFNRFESQSLNLLDDASRIEWEGHDDIPRDPSPTPFASVTEAYFEFELTLNGLVDLRQRHDLVSVPSRPRPLGESRVAFRGALEAWKRKFEALWPLLRDSEMEAALTLRIRQIAFEIALGVDAECWELGWDEFLPQHRQIVELSRQLLEEYHPLSSSGAGGGDGYGGGGCASMFSFAASVSEPLYITASSCRDGAVRREAIELLRLWPRRECLWDSVLAASLAESIMLLEESAVGNLRDVSEECYCAEGLFICHGHRVADAKLELLGEGVGMVTLRTVNDVVGERRGQVIQLSW